jgi:hypothetical protein
MRDAIRRNSKSLFIAVFVLVLVAVVGSYLLARSHAEEVPRGLLKPVSLGIAPYQYIAYSSSLAETQRVTGVDNYFAAFITADKGCTPSWGGTEAGDLNGKRAQDIKTDIETLRKSGGHTVISFGGASGTELALACESPVELAKAYQRVISKYGVARVDFDIEGNSLSDHAAGARRAQAIQRLQRSNPRLQVWVTLPVHAAGLTDDGKTVLSQLVASQVVINGINIMAMNYNTHTRDMGDRARSVAESTVRQLANIYPVETKQTLWKSLMITVMAGHNNTPDEIFTLQDARTLHDFASKKGVGTLAVWNVARDTPCPSPDTVQPSVSCSGVKQQPFEFIKTLSIPSLK